MLLTSHLGLHSQTPACAGTPGRARDRDSWQALGFEEDAGSTLNDSSVSLTLRRQLGYPLAHVLNNLVLTVTWRGGRTQDTVPTSQLRRLRPREGKSQPQQPRPAPSMRCHHPALTAMR